MKWTRKEVKERAKEALRRNYWKVVFVTFIFIVLSGGVSSHSSSSVVNRGEDEKTHALVVIETDEAEEDGDSAFAEMMNTIGDSIGRALDELSEARIAAVVALSVAFAVIFIIAMLTVLVVDVFLINPLWVGAQRFMLKCVDDKGNISELGYTFDHHYLNGVKTTFMRDLYIFLWTLLLIIPGICKKYQYYMVEFILAENPDMPYKEVLERSKKMMDGQKWDAFVLDLSFILWHMLTFVTCGISEIAFTKPYVNLTRAALYRTLCGDVRGTVTYIDSKPENNLI